MNHLARTIAHRALAAVSLAVVVVVVVVAGCGHDDEASTGGEGAVVDAEVAGGEAGLYGGRGELDGEVITAGWVVLDHGDQRGVFVDPRPPRRVVPAPRPRHEGGRR